MKPIAFVIPWYGDGIRGGAEQACNYMAHALSESGLVIEILTTCVHDAAADRGINTMRAGSRIESGIMVRRFRVKKRNRKRYDNSNYKIYHELPFDETDEIAYYEEDINSPGMYKYIKQNRDNYRCFIFMPYLYGISYHGSMDCPGNCMMIPCLHDESYAYMKLTREMVERMHGLIFLSDTEMKLASNIYRLDGIRSEVLGIGVDAEWKDKCDEDRFRKKYSIVNDFILYAGRKDKGKKVDELIRFYCRYMDTHDVKLDLVLIGGGEIEIPAGYRIHDLGFVSIDDKRDALVSSAFLCNPSHLESFSIVIMESWLACRPVLVSEKCKVTTDYCNKTNGGLYYNGYIMFEATVDYLLTHKTQADQMGRNGNQYVKQNFVKDVIIEKYRDFIDEVFPE